MGDLTPEPGIQPATRAFNGSCSAWSPTFGTRSRFAAISKAGVALHRLGVALPQVVQRRGRLWQQPSARCGARVTPTSCRCCGWCSYSSRTADSAGCRHSSCTRFSSRARHLQQRHPAIHPLPRVVCRPSSSRSAASTGCTVARPRRARRGPHLPRRRQPERHRRLALRGDFEVTRLAAARHEWVGTEPAASRVVARARLERPLLFDADDRLRRGARVGRHARHQVVVRRRAVVRPQGATRVAERRPAPPSTTVLRSA